MFQVMGNAQFLLFAMLSPVMGMAGAIDAKRKGRRSERSERDRFARELSDLADQLEAASDDERRRRAVAHPDPAEVVRRVDLPSVSLWERRPGDPDFLHLRVGVGDVPWRVPVTEPPALKADTPAALADLLDEASTLRGGAVPLDLSGGGVVGIVGDRAAALAVARSLVCQAAALHGPADLPMMVLAGVGCGPDWDWAKWLPHTRDATGAGRMLSDHAELSTAMVESRLKAAGPRDRFERRTAGGPAVGPTLLVVVDDESLTEGRRAPTRNLLRGDAGLGGRRRRRLDRRPAARGVHRRGRDHRRGRRRRPRPAPGRHAHPRHRAVRHVRRRRPRAAPARWPASRIPSSIWSARGCRPRSGCCRCSTSTSAPPRRCWPGGRRRGPTRGPPPRWAWPRTACSRSTSWPTAPTRSSAARPAPASPSCCGRWSRGWRRRSTPTTSRSCWSTSRAAAPSTSAPSCRTPSAW